MPASAPAPASLPASAPAIAPSRRFGSARTSLGEFGRSGSWDALQRGLGHYTRTGVGGARRAAQRLSGTAQRAARLHSVLSSASAGRAADPSTGLEFASLTGRSSADVTSGIIKAICPSNGTQDVEASRASLAVAFADLLAMDGNADLLSLSEPQIDFLVERFVAYDVSHRIELDVGAAIQKRAPDARTAVRRLEEVREFVRQKVAAEFENTRKSGNRITTQNVRNVSGSVIESVFHVFEEYV